MGVRVSLPAFDERKIFVYDYDEMNGGAVTVQLPKVEVNETRLLPDNYKQNGSDHSFEEKLKFEQARLGLLFSPFSQLESLFSSPLNLSLGAGRIENNLNSYLALEQPSSSALRASEDSRPSSVVPRPSSPQIFDSAPLQPFNQQLLQQLLTQTNWLIPNLFAQSLFAQAFTEGKLLPKLDLQFLVDQIIEQVKLVKSKEKVELSLTLKPEELGEILLILTSRSGIVSIQIQASPETKKLIESQREELERALKKAKINFDKIQVQEVEKYVPMSR